MSTTRLSGDSNTVQDAVGLGIVTFNRPDFFSVAYHSVMTQLVDPGFIDSFVICNDGSDSHFSDAYSRVWQPSVERHGLLGDWGRENNRGVANLKNRCLDFLLRTGCQWLFLMEDDVEVLDAHVVEGYIAASGGSGWEHLNFHAHGDANPAPRWVSDSVTSLPNSVGAFSIYSRRSLEVCGLFDEAMVNAFEHVEHTQPLATEGFTAPWPDNLDATNSELWLREQPSSMQNSSIRQRPEWQEQMLAAQRHWLDTRPETYRLIWPA